MLLTTVVVFLEPVYTQNLSPYVIIVVRVLGIQYMRAPFHLWTSSCICVTEHFKSFTTTVHRASFKSHAPYLKDRYSVCGCLLCTPLISKRRSMSVVWITMPTLTPCSCICDVAAKTCQLLSIHSSIVSQISVNGSTSANHLKQHPEKTGPTIKLGTDTVKASGHDVWLLGVTISSDLSLEWVKTCLSR